MKVVEIQHRQPRKMKAVRVDLEAEPGEIWDLCVWCSGRIVENYGIVIRTWGGREMVAVHGDWIVLDSDNVFFVLPHLLYQKEYERSHVGGR